MLLGPAVVSGTVVSQGCRPVGQAYVVTRATDNVIHDLAGVPALDRLREIVAALAPGDRALVQEGLHVGQVIDEQQDTFGRGDFLVRNVMGADAEAGDIAIGGARGGGLDDPVPRPGRRQCGRGPAPSPVRPARHAPRWSSPATGAAATSSASPTTTPAWSTIRSSRGAVAGMSCAGELGPIGRRNFVHTFTASVVLFDG